MGGVAGRGGAKMETTVLEQQQQIVIKKKKTTRVECLLCAR